MSTVSDAFGMTKTSWERQLERDQILARIGQYLKAASGRAAKEQSPTAGLEDANREVELLVRGHSDDEKFAEIMDGIIETVDSISRDDTIDHIKDHGGVKLLDLVGNIASGTKKPNVSKLVVTAAVKLGEAHLERKNYMLAEKYGKLAEKHFPGIGEAPDMAITEKLRKIVYGVGEAWGTVWSPEKLLDNLRQLRKSKGAAPEAHA